MSRPNVTIYTDGSWRRHRNLGAWAALMVCGNQWQIIADTVPRTTISRMELSSIINALQHLIVPCNVTIISDSQYAVKIINEWLSRWEINGFITANNTPVANQDLLTQLSQLAKIHFISAAWVKSHTKNKDVISLGNAVVDEFAQCLTR